MKAVLLCAGFATRLYPLTRNRAKPLLPVAGRPLLTDLVMQIVSTESFEEVVVVTNRRFQAEFEAWLHHLRPSLGAEPPELRLVENGVLTDETRLGAVHDLALAVEQMTIDGPLLIAAGDNLFRFPLEELLDDYRSRPRSLVVLHEEDDVEKLRRTGVAQVDGDGRIVAFSEKPLEPPSNLSSAPLYLLRRDALHHLERFLTKDPQADAPGYFIAYLAEKQPIFGHRMRGRRLDLGDLDTYRRAEAWLHQHGTSASPPKPPTGKA